MSEHYYAKNPTVAHDEKEITVDFHGNSLRFTTDAGVFSKGGLDDGSRLLIEDALEIDGRALDLGCGWGAVGVCIASVNQDVKFVFTDVNERAAALTEKNLRKNGVKGCSVVSGDGFSAVTGKFDHILLNPPIRAGKATIYRLFEEAREYLNPEGCLHIVMMTRQGADSARKKLDELFGNCEITSRGSGYKVMVSRLTSEEV